MATVSPDQLAQEVHSRGVRLVIAVTGGGSSAISTLLTTPGASRSILAAVVPYSQPSLIEWLGARPDEFSSDWTARAMAMAAYLKAHGYDPTTNVCGVACTASLASDRPKRGSHRAHFAYQSASTTATLSLNLEKGRRSRAEEEAVVAATLLNHIAEACGAAGRLVVPLATSESLDAVRVVAPQEQQDLLAGRVDVIGINTAPGRPRPLVVFPGSFHPRHRGHEQMAEVAARLLGQQVAYEISIVNVEKPHLDFIEIQQRMGQFSAGQPVWLSRAPHFTQKARLFPAATFVVGVDTLARICDPRYYEGNHDAVERAIVEIASQGCTFLAFGRTMDGAFRTLADLRIPVTLARLCREVPEEMFRDDSSSTQLRKSSADN